VEVAQKLGDISWQLEKGLGGMGRSRMGMVVTADLRSSWLGSFPDNPFSVPLVVDRSGDAPQLAIGLVEGQIRTAMETFTALKKADLELDHPEEAERQGAEIDRSSWRDLSKDERDACPPLLLVGTSETLAGKGLCDLLETDLPIKVLVLSDLSFSTDDVAFTALALRKAFVAQCSISDPGHFYACLRDGLHFSGPALIHVHAPSPTRHGYDAHRTVERAQMAVHSRAFPIFRYNPAGEGVFGLHLDLRGNPAPESTFAEDEELGLLTPAHWAARERRFAESISPLGEDAGATTAVADYLLLPEEQRSGKTPFVTMDGETRHGISSKLVRAFDERVSIWRALQELAGLVTPFTHKVREEAEQAVAEIHKAEIQSLRSEYEEKIQSSRAENQSEIAEKIRNQLLVLTGYKSSQ
jgi:pyruvate-ferredoxin/flavodoxin oxidoreductase